MMNDSAKKLLAPLTRPDAETDFRIKTGTEMYRKGFCRLDLKTPDGKPVPAAEVRTDSGSFRQTFRFSCGMSSPVRLTLTDPIR